MYNIFYRVLALQFMIFISTFFLDSDGHIIPGLFEYIAEGIIPLLHTFYCSFFNPKEAGNPTQREREYSVSTIIATNLAVCFLN